MYMYGWMDGHIYMDVWTHIYGWMDTYIWIYGHIYMDVWTHINGYMDTYIWIYGCVLEGGGVVLSQTLFPVDVLRLAFASLIRPQKLWEVVKEAYFPPKKKWIIGLNHYFSTLFSST